jgi:hypothetical protein
MKEVTVMWIRVPNMETKGGTVAPLYRDRFVLRILSILKIKEQAPSSEDSESVTTHPPTPCPARYTDTVIACRSKTKGQVPK